MKEMEPVTEHVWLETYCGMQTHCWATTARYENIQQPLLSNVFANKHVPKATTELQRATVFSARSVPRCYKWDKLGAAVVECGEEYFVGD
jgi:hypothetical protein